MIHTTGETNAQATVNKAIKYLDLIGMAYADHTIDDVSVIQETIKMMKDEGYQAVFVANDNKLASHGNMAILGGACLENGLPLYCAAFKEGESLPPAFHKKSAIMKRVFLFIQGLYKP